MRVIVAHNYYQRPGGEDRVFEDEMRLLRSEGHAVTSFALHNRTIADRRRFRLAAETLWNRSAASGVRELVRRTGADVAHFHNTFPLISPAAYYGARAAGAAVVQTLHNYRLICPAARLFRNGQTCEACLGKTLPWPAVAHGCYRSSRPQSAVAAATNFVHSIAGTWRRAVDLYLTPSEFARQKFIEAGLPAQRIVVKPNFILNDPCPGSGDGGYAVFVGRLEVEKGVAVLLEAWSLLRASIPLILVGDGPLADQVRRTAAIDGRIRLVGWQQPQEVSRIVGQAAFLVMPSLWYETFGLTIAESFASGTPVVAARLGAMAEAVKDGRSGLLFEPGSASDLADKVRRLWNDRALRLGMRRAARGAYLTRYKGRANAQCLRAAYELAIASRRSGNARIPTRECSS